MRFDRRLAKCILNILTDNDKTNCILDMQQENYTSSSVKHGKRHSTTKPLAVGPNFFQNNLEQIQNSLATIPSNINIIVTKAKPIVGQIHLQICSYDDPLYL